MRYIFITLMILSGTLMCIPNTAHALIPKLFIGANLQVNSPVGDFSKTDLVDKKGGAKTGIGSELDLGITTKSISLYGGYRFGKHDLKGDSTVGNVTVKSSGDWTVNRFVAGLRFNLLSIIPLPVEPTIGGGATFGKAKLSSSASYGGMSYSLSETSKNNIGWFAELAVLVTIPRTDLGVLAGAQYHRFDAKFENGGMSTTIPISFFTFQAGLRYTISL